MVQLQTGACSYKQFAKRHETKIRFILAGGINTVVGLSIYPILFFLMAPLKLHYLVILVFSQIICVIFAYLTNKFLVFKTTGNYIREFSKFVTFHLAYFAANLVALPILVEFVRINPVWAQTAFAALVIVSSYFWHSQITFSSKKASN